MRESYAPNLQERSGSAIVHDSQHNCEAARGPHWHCDKCGEIYYLTEGYGENDLLRQRLAALLRAAERTLPYLADHVAISSETEDEPDLGDRLAYDALRDAVEALGGKVDG